MVYVYARHAVEDYERWERFHEDNADTRAAHGSVGTQVFRSRGGGDAPEDGDGDADAVVLLLQEVAEDRLGEMLEYYDSEAFEETMAEAGVREVLDAGVVEKVHEMDR